MLPSDHFTRFYNEVFKFLEKQDKGDLEKFWIEVISKRQVDNLRPFQKDGLKGLHDYWEMIRVEENCDMSCSIENECLKVEMYKCPSLSKVMDNDATQCEKYCDHCPGWAAPALNELGFFAIFDIKDRYEPQCVFFVFDELKKAEAKLEEYDEETRKRLVLSFK